VKYYHDMSRETGLFDQLLAVTVMLDRDMTRGLGALGLTASRTHLLWELRRLGPSTQQALAVALEVSPRNVTGLVDALQHDGFLERRPHPNDRRAALVTLTSRGEEVMARMAADHGQLAADLFGRLTPEEAEVLSRALGKVTDRLSELIAVAEDEERPA
jgi:DNA-binding MarR family transcriptional regulator